ncbi:uncharacterized protein LOC102802815 [Saccoglossus kowalevskii]|uniref:Uncharacterized protein LOC102802815 n=1 Tax=Saccoglossus kowalevskii TaxID=10224 RepID=A0ABM0M2J5_SACKO|nr:PREDICTED: uncharacterized protein LOC102802815 [Saccoglossus kowalevskii]
MEPDKVKRSNILVTRSVDTHHSYTPSFNRGKDFNITKIISSESSSRIIPYHNTSTESYPERSMGSSHHFRRAEKAETLAQLAARRSNSTGGLKYLDSTSPERYDTIDEQYEDMMTHEPRSVASHSHYRHIKTPMVTEASTISLSLGDKVYSNYDRFASARKNNRPPLLRHHPKRY